MSIKQLRTLALFFLALPALAAPPAGYYDPVNATNAATLRQTLHGVIDDHTRFPYTSDGIDTWLILELADEDPGDATSILDLYKNASYPKAGGGNAFYNREHSWPNSYGFPNDVTSNYPYTDCHALFLSDSGYNSSRGNSPYRTCGASCTEKPTEANHGRGGGTGVYPGSSNWRTGSGSDSTGTWETWTGRRGEVARALFYMDVRYEGGSHGVTGHAEPNLQLTDDDALIETSGGVNASFAYMGELSVLRQWHAQDPVDDVERHRNDVVSEFQGNRNPFIDHPEWVECLYGTLCAGSGGGEALELRNGRFHVTLTWSTAQSNGTGHPVSLTDESGYFWFFNQSNVEVLVKVIDGCTLNDRFWVFAAGLTDVHAVITVVDTLANETQTYENFQGTAFAPIQDTDAFATCGAGPNTAPNAAFNASYSRRLIGQFTDASSDPDGSIVAWNWDFGDGQTSTAQSPSHSYFTAGTYTIRLTVTDNDGSTSSTTRVLQVCTSPGICCRTCTSGRACGGSCIASHLSCSQPIGCACDDWELCS